MVAGLSVQDIVYAAVAALMITWLVEFFLKSFGVMFARATTFEYKHSDFEHMAKKCCDIFPRDVVEFKGRKYLRGMTVRIVSLDRKVCEGCLVGTDYDNTICLLTRKYIITQDISNIKEMNILE